MRSLLTMLGIIIGVAAVIAMVGIGNGAQASIDAQINSLGRNVILVFSGTTTRGGVSAGAGSSPSLTEEDAVAIKNECNSISYISPILRNNGQIVFGNVNWGTTIQGTNVDFFKIRDWQISEGEYFFEQDVRAATKVCILGQTVVNQLFQNESPIGKTIRIKKIPFKVIGILNQKGQNMMGQDQDDIIIVPFTTVQKRLLGVTKNWMFIASAKSKEKILAAQNEISELLRRRHKLTDEEDNDFTIRTQTEIAETSSSISKIMTMLLGSIAGISLIVGGIGIMNIMLVSVTERTREIGIRMAIGAKRIDILLQFLIEAIAIGVVGGIIGILLGIFTSNIIAKFSGWPILVSSDSILISVVFAMLIGIFFGFYPAKKAANLHPIEALRYE